MQSKQNLIDLRKKMPYGSIKKISNITGSSRIAITKFFKGELKNPKKINEIQEAIIIVLNELKDKNNEFYNNVTEIL
ncbi:hypothetical protein [Flavobacterium psychrophilum]|uniref:hypothetical protein n=1 Tax=Flavobacterium psychrophilum TaxID=96345 RepID=UPI001D0720AA|nr:hypothetical protein [Flavobacterium psychrophilum]MCB6062523.1 hypothetical protein [Flavobacterium psychrophilum]MEB3378383.1 hypothetical protein [Flavobacterium psychrophilum]